MMILAIGDIIGRPGRKAVNDLLSDLRRQYEIDLVIANAENAAGGIGLTESTARELLDAGADVLTSGNHIWAEKDIIPHLDSDEMPILRPLNYPPGVPGRGYLVTKGVTVVNLIGRTFLGEFDCPFRAMDQLLDEIDSKSPIIIDFHAEATSEKMALGRYLDGRVTAVLGTHTHVGTIDAQILPQGTAYVTDIGMVGPINSVIGDDTNSVLRRFLTAMPHRLSVAKGKTMFTAILLKVDDNSRKAIEIERIYREVN